MVVVCILPLTMLLAKMPGVSLGRTRTVDLNKIILVLRSILTQVSRRKLVTASVGTTESGFQSQSML